MRINKAIFRYIEFELYNYEQTKKDLQLERERILESSPCQEVAVQSDIGDSTANKAIKLTSSGAKSPSFFYLFVTKVLTYQSICYIILLRDRN